MLGATDTQLTAIFGRNRLINDLLRSGIEVAAPVRDRGVDLIAYLDIDEQIGRFAAVPIQTKTATQRWFSMIENTRNFRISRLPSSGVSANRRQPPSMR